MSQTYYSPFFPAETAGTKGSTIPVVTTTTISDINTSIGNIEQSIQELESGGAFDTTAPGAVTGLALSSTVVVDTDGSQIVTLKATWTASPATDLNRYDIAISEAGGGFIEFAAGKSATEYNWRVRGNQSFSVKIRAIDDTGNVGPWSTTVTGTSAKDLVAPAAATALTGSAAFNSIFLSWTNPADLDIHHVEIWESSTNSTGAAIRIATPSATPGTPGAFTRTGLAAGSTRYYWLKSVDTSGNASGFSTGSGAITCALITEPDFAANLSPIKSYATNPSPTGYTGPDIIYNTTDKKLYRYTGTAWVPVVNTDDLSGTIDGTQIGNAVIDATKFASSIKPVEIVSTLPTTGNVEGRTVYLTTDKKLYRYNGTAFIASVAATDITGQITAAQITDASISTIKMAAGLEVIENVSTLPTTGNFTGRIAFLTTDGKLYRYTGSAWTAAVPTTDLSGTIATAQLADSAVTQAKIADASISVAKMAAGLRPVEIVSTLPSTGNVQGRMVLLTTDNKLYRYTGTAWTAIVSATDTQFADGSLLSALQPAAAGATPNAPTIGIDINVNPAGAANSGEGVLFGYNAGGTKAAIDGYIMWKGAKVYVPRIAAHGYTFLTQLAGTGYLVFDTDKRDLFSSNGSPCSLVYARKVGTEWQYDNSVSWVTFTPDAEHAVIGELETGSDVIISGRVFTDALPIGSIGSFASLNGITPSNVATYIASQAIGSTQLVDDSVITSKIAAGAVTAAELAANAVNNTKLAAGLTTVEILGALPSTGNFVGRTVFLTTDSKLYRYNGTAFVASVAAVDLTGQITGTQIADTSVALSKFATGLRPIETVSVLPAAGTAGRIVFLTTDNKLYRDTGTAWTTAVPAVDITGTISAAQIASGAVDLSKLANGLTGIEIVSALPTAGNFAGRTVMLTTDGKLYRYSGSAFTAAVPSIDITGTISTAQIADNAITVAKIVDDAITAAKLAAGAVDSTALANSAVTTAKFASGLRPVEILGTLPAAGTQGRMVLLTTDNKLYRDTGSAWVSSVPATDVTGQLTDAQLAAISAAKLTGTITTTQITDDAITTAKIFAGAVTAAEIAANAITAGKIAAGVITATEIAANTITATQLAANSVTASEIAANVITAGHIAVGAITATEIAAGAIVASKLAIGDTSNVFPDPDFAELSLYTATGGSISRISVAGAAASKYALQMAITTAAVDIDGPAFGVEPSKPYFFSSMAWRSAGGSVPSITFSVKWYSDVAATTLIQTDVVGISTVSSIGTRSSAILTAPATARQARLFWSKAANATFQQITIMEPIVRRASNGELIVDGSITADKIAANAITAGKIAAGTIVAADIAAATITGAKIAAGTITATNIAVGTITANEIAANTITSAKIAADTITAANLAANSVTASEIAANVITAGHIAAGTITATEIAAGTITGTKIAGTTITGGHIAANTITATQIAANTITATQIAAGTITANEIAAGTITASQIATDTITATQLAIGDFQNLIYNGELFTTAGLPTTGRMAVVSDSANAYGSKSYVIKVDPAAGSSWNAIGVAFPTTAGETFYIDWWAKTVGVTSGGSQLQIRWENAAGGQITASGPQTAGSAHTSYTNFTTIFTAPAGAVRGKFQIYNTNTAGTVYIGQLRAYRRNAGKLIVDGEIVTNHLAANAVTAAKIAANTITATEIASATITGDRIAANTITASNLVANTITAGQIAAGAIGTNQLAANAVTANTIAAGAIVASKLTLTDTSNMVPDSDMIDANAWTATSGTFTFVDVSTVEGLTSKQYINTNTGATQADIYSQPIAVDPGKPYYVRGQAWVSSAGNATANLYLRFYSDAAATVEVANSAVLIKSNTAVFIVATSTAETQVTVPTAAKRVKFHMNRVTLGTGAANGRFGSLSLRRAANAELIVDGSITAAEIAVTSITGDRLVANTITATQIAANTITANQIAANTITAAKIQAGTITATEINDSTITNAKIVNATLTGAKIAANTITATNIAANTITANEIAANTITAGQIAAGTISATQLAANSIIASKLVVADMSNFVQDPGFTDPVYWTLGTGVTYSTDSAPATALGVAKLIKSPVGNGTTSQPDAATTVTATQKAMIEGGAQFRVSYSWYVTAGFTGAVSARIHWYKADGTTAASVANSTVPNFVDYRVAAAPAAASGIATGIVTAPLDAMYAILHLRYTWSTTLANAGNAYHAYPVINRAVNGDLIVDGAITAAKIAANTITATQIAATTITASQIASNAITSDKIAANAIIAGKISAGIIGTTELAANAVTAAKITAGTITGDRLAANTITATQIAANTITAAELAANTITAGQIAAGAISASEIAAGAVLASKIAIGDTSNASVDPLMVDTGSWTGTYSFIAYTGAPSASKNYLVIAAVAAAPQEVHSIMFPIEAGKPYFASIIAWSGTAGNAQAQAGVKWLDHAGALISNSLLVTTTGANASTRYSAQITAPATARYAQWYLNRDAAGANNADVGFAEPIIRRAMNGELIVDGQITAAKIAAGTITATQIASGTITGAQIFGGTITGDKIQAGTIQASNLAANSISARELAVGSFGEGLMLNPGAESGTTASWQTIESIGTGHSFVATTADKSSGTYSFALNKTAAANGVNMVSDAVPVVPGKTYVAKFMVRGNTATSNGLHARVRMAATKASGTNYVSSSTGEIPITPNDGPITTSWVQKEIAFTVASGCFWVSIWIWNWANGPTQVLIDDVQVKEQYNGTLISNGAVTTNHVTANTLNGDRIQAATLTVDKLTVIGGGNVSNNQMPAGIYVGTTGTTIGTVQANADNPANRINALTTTIDPGKILISGATTLASWRNGTDTTKIEGGSIAANTITANKLTIGSRGVTITGVEFEWKPSTNQIGWTEGHALYNDDNNNPVATIIYGGLVSTTSWRYFYWTKGTNTIQHTDNWGVARSVDNLHIATWHGGSNLIVHYGGTIIDGSKITTGSITASQLSTGQLITQSGQIGDAVITNAKIGNLQVDTIKIANGSIGVPYTVGASDLMVLRNTTAAFNVIESSWLTIGDANGGGAVITFSTTQETLGDNKFLYRFYVDTGGGYVEVKSVTAGVRVKSSQDTATAMVGVTMTHAVSGTAQVRVLITAKFEMYTSTSTPSLNDGHIRLPTLTIFGAKR